MEDHTSSSALYWLTPQRDRATRAGSKIKVSTALSVPFTSSHGALIWLLAFLFFSSTPWIVISAPRLNRSCPFCDTVATSPATPAIAGMSESPSRSRSNGLTNVLSRTRQRHQKNGDSASSSIKSAESDGKKGFRDSLDSALERLKGLNESDDEQEPTGIKKLVPTIVSKRRRRKQEREDELRASEEAERGRSVAERGTLENAVERRNGSVATRSGDGSSLLTYDSDIES